MKYITIVLLLVVHTWAVEPARAPQGAERVVVAAVIVAESGGHGRKGMSAVYEVVFERASRRGTSCYAEVIRYKQFSCLNGKKPIRVRAASLVQRMSKHPEYKWVHDTLLGGAVDPVTGKAGKKVPLTDYTGPHPGARCTHYHTTSISPSWVKIRDSKGKVIGVKKPAYTFGGHHWYNNVK